MCVCIYVMYIPTELGSAGCSFLHSSKKSKENTECMLCSNSPLSCWIYLSIYLSSIYLPIYQPIFYLSSIMLEQICIFKISVCVCVCVITVQGSKSTLQAELDIWQMSNIWEK